MPSIDAQNVAREVLETIGSGKKVVLGRIIKKHGYSNVTAKVPSTVTNTKSYQGVTRPVINKWVKEIERLTNALSNKDLTEEKYDTIVKSIEILNKNVQLLTGGDTEKMSGMIIVKSYE